MLLDGYDPQMDSIASYHEAIAALATRHRMVVSAMVPKLRVARGNRFPAKVLARRLGVSHSAVKRWEAGDLIPSPAMFDRWRAMVGL